MGKPIKLDINKLGIVGNYFSFLNVVDEIYKNIRDL